MSFSGYKGTNTLTVRVQPAKDAMSVQSVRHDFLFTPYNLSGLGLCSSFTVAEIIRGSYNTPS